jgi:hypothetical protein
MQSEKEAKLQAKRREEELKRMEQHEKQQRERSERLREADLKFPEIQFNMLLSGIYARYQFSSPGGGDSSYNNYSIPMRPALIGVPAKINQQAGVPIKVIDIESGLDYLREKWPLVIELNEQTINRLAEFAKPDETYAELLNRLMDHYNNS